MQRQAKYKPLLFTTTMRNPAWLKNFLSVLKEYNRQVLDNKLAKKLSIYPKEIKHFIGYLEKNKELYGH
ncbi:MAG: hypothetical protein OXH36_00750 [Bdellovibrionales bacterium]|nr:hypothetical protein [Bdellovibrionales bacterium]